MILLIIKIILQIFENKTYESLTLIIFHSATRVNIFGRQLMYVSIVLFIIRMEGEHFYFPEGI